MKKTIVILSLLTAITMVEAGEELAMVQRSLPFLKEQGLAWIADRQCASCHQIPAMLWSLNSAFPRWIEN